MLNITELTLRRGTKALFEGANLIVHSGHKVGVLGANGCGKSSLFSAILGTLDVDGGRITLPPGIRIAHLRQETPALDRPAIEYVMDGDGELRDIQAQIKAARSRDDGLAEAHAHAHFESIHGYTAHARAAQLLHGLGFSPDDEFRPVAEFSGGFRIRLNLAQALMARSDLLLLDEPTNHLDLETVMWLENWLGAYPGTLLVIAHDREFLDQVTNHILHFEAGRLELHRGNYSTFEIGLAQRRAQQNQAHVKQQRDIIRIKAFVDRFRAKATKARQAQSRMKALERMELIAPAHESAGFSFTFPPPERLPNPLIKLERTTVGYGTTPILSNIDLSIEPGQRIGLLGRNGAGKSTLIRLLAGERPAGAGQTTCARDLNIGYFAQHQLEQLDLSESPLQVLAKVMPTATTQALKNHLGGFGFSGDRALAPCEGFSGGEKARLVLATLVAKRPNLLLLDEPTNHLDIDMRHALNMALQDYSGALILVSHDRHLIRAAADDLLLVENGGVTSFKGDLEDYRRRNPWEMEPSAQAPRQPSRHAEGERPKQNRRQVQAERRRQHQPLRSRISRLERELEKLVRERDSLDDILAGQLVYTPENKRELRDTLHDRARIATKIDDLETEWMEISEQLENLAETDLG